MDAYETTNQQAREQALGQISDWPTRATTRVSYQSKGRVLVIAMDLAMAQAAAQRLRPALQPAIVLTSAGATEQVDGIAVLHTQGREPLVEGYLGHFQVTLAVGEEVANVAQLLRVADGVFDLILDLGVAPLMSAEWPPVGYFAPAFGDAEALDAAIAQLVEMLGEFEKPKFFHYDPTLCAHGRNGIQGCTRCLEACPALAIRSVGEQIEVQPSLCQGGGVCATVCPSGAIIYSYPEPGDLLGRLHSLLQAYARAGGQDPVVLFHDDEAGQEGLQALQPLPGQVLAVEVDEVGSVGPELWLACLAAGARAVRLLETPVLPARVKRSMNEAMSYTRNILQTLGYAGGAVGWVRGSMILDPEQWLPRQEAYAIPVRHNAKREHFFAAVNHLYALAPQPVTEISLSVGAPFGQINVDRQACTLCMACVTVCPAQALGAPPDRPRLDFTEERCLQCGLCVEACPEEAIRLQPRLLTDPAARRTPRALNEEEPFCCVSCGKPFATQSMIDMMSRKLEGHRMFQDERAKRRLLMCENCRVVDLLQDANAAQP